MNKYESPLATLLEFAAVDVILSSLEELPPEEDYDEEVVALGSTPTP